MCQNYVFEFANLPIFGERPETPDSWGYTVYGTDRTASHSGSVMLLIRLCYTSIKVKLDTNCETIWAEELLKGQRKLYVSPFYCSINHQHAHLDKFRETYGETYGESQQAGH